MAPALWTALTQLFRKSEYTPVPQDPDLPPPTSPQDGNDSTQNSPQAANPDLDTQDGDESTHDGALTSDPKPSAKDDDGDVRGDKRVPSALFHFFRFSPFLTITAAGAMALGDAAPVNATAAMRALVTKVKQCAEMLVAKFKEYIDWARQNPRQAALIAACILIPVIFTACTPAILAAIGFSAAGPVAGSLAAALQAHIGIAGAGSLFAIVQSAAMAGYGLPIVLSAVWVGTSVVCWGARALWRKFMDGPEGEDDGETVSMAVVR